MLGVLNDYVRSESLLCELSATVRHKATLQEEVIFLLDAEAILQEAQSGIS